MKAPASPVGRLSRRAWLVGVGLAALADHSRAALPPASSSRALRLIGGELPPVQGESTRLAETAIREASRLGVDRPVEWLPWARALKEARGQGQALVFPVLRAPEREQDWHWLHRLGRDELVLWVRRDAWRDGDDPACLKDLRVGVVKQSVLGQRLRAQGFQALSEVSAEDVNARMLAAGRIQAWASLRSASAGLVQGIDPLRSLLHAPRVLGALDYYLAATPDVAAINA